MIEDNITKFFWIIAAIVIIGIIGTNIFDPTIDRIESLSDQIQKIDYSAPSN